MKIRRHNSRSTKRLYRKYWSRMERQWIFSVKSKMKQGSCVYRVIRLGSLGIKRYIKIKADANPYDSMYTSYIWQRKAHRRAPKKTKARRQLIQAARGTMAGVFNKNTF